MQKEYKWSMAVRGRRFSSGRCGLAFTAACVLSLAALQALPAATHAYQGKFRGTTAQGKPISFVVSAGDRVVSLNLAYALPGCDVKQQINTSAPIRAGSFTFSLKLPNNSVSLRGRFTSSSKAAGTLTASGDCGRASTTWKAAKGGAPAPAPKPKPKPQPKPSPTPFEGSWDGKVTFPVGLDPDLLDYLDAVGFLLGVFGGGIESADVPFLIQGAGCATGDFVGKDFRPPVKFKGKSFSLSFTTKNGIKVALTGTFDSAKRAHGTLTTKGSFEGCTGQARMTWRASNLR